MTKIAIVTGASRGFGRGIAQVLATEAGYKVYATARNKSALDELKKAVDANGGQGQIIPIVLDQTDDTAVTDFVNQVTSSESKIDLLVNSAYGGLIAMTPHFGKPFWERPISVFDGSMEVGVRSSYVMSKLVAPYMVKEKNGLIVQISSYGGFVYLFDVGYGVSHAAMDRLSFDMATELRDHNVRAITLHPGAGQTEITAFPDGESPEYVGRSVMALMEQADESFLNKANGKTVFTADLANEFKFFEDGDTDGSLNIKRLEGLKPYKEMSIGTLAQYDINAALPNYSDTNNIGFADLFPGAKD
ncbi:MAG: SDR family NAD(P)-dependent oxidoreductase [Proteobacteria bacterium]|jgi:dehydrogenase/reductase SDR family protein 1|nr:SDR family NAD(P)-dependent oxidoreductase [Pseudomonadota bacterium]